MGVKQNNGKVGQTSATLVKYTTPRLPK